MKVKDIVAQNNFVASTFENWLRGSQYKWSDPLFGGLSIDDGQNINDIINSYQKFVEEDKEKKAKEMAEQAAQAEEEEKSAKKKQQALASMLITSGFSFDGYSITKYSGYISGDSAVSMDRPTHGWTGRVNKDVGGDLLAGLSQIRREALAELKEAAYLLGCNAVIGVDFDYLTLDPETATNQGGTLYLPFLFAVTANGNAVVIERN